MSIPIVDQSESERRLHRVLYVLMYLRAMIIQLILLIFIGVLFLLTGIDGIGSYSIGSYIGSFEAEMKTFEAETKMSGFGWYLYLFISTFIIAFLLWTYQSIVRVWRWPLKFQAAFMFFGVFMVLFIFVTEVLFAINHLAPVFSIILGLVAFLGVAVPLDMAVALWGVSRSQDTSSFRATLDPRLTSGPWSYWNKLLDLPRTPFHSVKSIIAYALAMFGAVLLVTCIMQILSVGGIRYAMPTLESECVKSPIQCTEHSATLGNHALILLIISFIGMKLAAAMQSTARKIGGMTVSDALKHTSGRFILYLRPFHADSVILPKPRLPLFSQFLTFRPFPVRIEEELFDVADGFLPLIAVGAPGGSATSGDRAHREYLAGSIWRTYVTEKLDRADSIVIVIWNTEGIRWELSRVLTSTYVTKTLLLFHPSAKEAKVWDHLSAYIVQMMKDAELVSEDFRFQGRPLGFYFHGGELVEVQNSNWSATSYRSAFSHFLSERAKSDFA